jgi:hypothetical protein
MSAFCIAIALWLLLTLLVFRVRVIAELAGAADPDRARRSRPFPKRTRR